jgi:hypothetical protein
MLEARLRPLTVPSAVVILFTLAQEYEHGRTSMRGMMLASIVACGLGLAGQGGALATSAAPVNTNFSRAAAQTDLVQRAWYNRYGQWCGRRCNRFTGRCFIVCR